MQYEAVLCAPSTECDHVILGLGDFVCLRSGAEGQPYIGRIRELYAEPETDRKMLTVQWCYRKDDLPDSCQEDRDVTSDPSELFITDHFDANDLDAILNTTRVRFSFKSKGKADSYITSLFSDSLTTVHPNDEKGLLESAIWMIANSPAADFEIRRKFSVLKNRVSPISVSDVKEIHTRLYTNHTKSLAKELCRGPADPVNSAPDLGLPKTHFERTTIHLNSEPEPCAPETQMTLVCPMEEAQGGTVKRFKQAESDSPIEVAESQSENDQGPTFHAQEWPISNDISSRPCKCTIM